MYLGIKKAVILNEFLYIEYLHLELCGVIFLQLDACLFPVNQYVILNIN